MKRIIEPGQLLACLLLLCFSAGLFAQERIDPMLGLKYRKLGDGTKRLDISMQARVDGKLTPIEGAGIAIFSMRDTAGEKLSSVLTNYKGEASYDISPAVKLPVDKQGNFNFTFRYGGDSKYNKAEGSLQMKDVFLDLLPGGDTTATVFAYERNAKDEKVPVKDLDIVFSISRMFCLYPVGTAKTDASGHCSMAYPTDMPGDSIGRLTVVARIQDNDSYATVEQTASARWGKPVIPVVRKRRGLGDTDAPLWMVYTLIVLLSAVWIHFFYVIGLIGRINRIGKKIRATVSN